MTETLRLTSYAKINLRLDILKKRDDGYHDLRTLLQPIDLRDLLHFSLKNEKGISIKTDHPGLPLGKRNLVYQAAETILKRSGYEGGVRIRIKKRIPLGAGLGGGSSNAAATLKAMNQLLKLNLSVKKLMKMGVEIGADLPFFFMEGSAIALGIGEKLKKVELPGLWCVLIYPNFEVSTRWAYQSFMLTKKQFHLSFNRLKTPRDVSQILSNDLEKVVSRKYPEIDLMKRILCSAGALGASMTGSGPTVFGIFPGEEEAAKAFRKVKRMSSDKGWLVLKVRSLP
jgi:4-diphosphocytidyl-2-C-methyl-D-erythritol kinase